MREKCEISWYVKLAISVIVMLVSASVFLLVVKWMHFDSLTINDMMVSFVGILATFLVINNYAQVHDMKTDVETQLEKAMEQQKLFEKQLLNLSAQKKISNKMNLQCECNQESMALAIHLIRNKSSVFSIVTADADDSQGQLLSAKWRWKDEKIEFYTSNNPSQCIEHIMMVDEYEFDKPCVENMIKKYMS